MYGRRLYNYALTNVPTLAKECLDVNGLTLKDVKKVLIHQANSKMDEAILKRFFVYMVCAMPITVSCP